jgi:hypothetical protein
VTGDLIVTACAAVCNADGEHVTIGQPAEASAIPAVVRRRLRGTALQTVCCGLAAQRGARGPVEVVFCSRHGDLQRTQRLLLGLAQRRAPSPLEFSLSVHNALAGMLDLAREERTGHTSIAAGRDSLAMALLEAAARLSIHAGRAVLLLYVEDQIPDELQDQTEPGLGGTVLALLLESPSAAARALGWLRRAPAVGTPPKDSETEARSLLAVIGGGSPIRLASRAGFDWLVEGAR